MPVVNVWLFLWLMVFLKIPIVALFMIVKWAVGADPEGEVDQDGGIGPRSPARGPASPPLASAARPAPGPALRARAGGSRPGARGRRDAPRASPLRLLRPRAAAAARLLR